MSGNTNNLKLYCAWFCPFAQRAWAALVHKGLDFEYIEQNPYDKTPEWLAINPKGLVPTIIHNNNIISESSVIMEYLDDVWPDKVPLLPKDAYKRAYARMWSDHISKKIVPFYYACLMKQTKEEQVAASIAFNKGLETLAEAMDDTGPYFMGKEFGFVDLMLFPYIIRTLALEHFRDYKLPEGAMFDRIRQWWEECKKLSAYEKTVPDLQKLIESYDRYNKNTANTQVADAIRKGQSLP